LRAEQSHRAFFARIAKDLGERAMPDLLSEERISFEELAKRVGVHASTCSRWASRGCRGHRLSVIRTGGRVETTLPAYRRFFAAINGFSLPENGHAHTNGEAHHD